jgi:hypothetical protein
MTTVESAMAPLTRPLTRSLTRPLTPDWFFWKYGVRTPDELFAALNGEVFLSKGLSGLTGPDIRPRTWVDSSGVVRGMNKIANGMFLTGTQGWTDYSSGTGAVTWSEPGSVSINRVDASNCGKLKSSITLDSSLSYGFVIVTSGGYLQVALADVGLTTSQYISGNTEDAAGTISGSFTPNIDGEQVFRFQPTRNGETVVVRDIALFELPNADAIRIDSTQGDERALVEPASQQIGCWRGKDILTQWTASNATGAADSVGVDGVANTAVTLTDASAAAVGYYSLSVPISANAGPFSLAVAIAADSTPTAYPVAGLLFSGGTAKFARYVLNPTDGTSVAATGNTAASVSITNMGLIGSHYFYNIVATDNGSNSLAILLLDPAWAETFTANSDVAAQGSNTFDAIQLSYGISHAHSYVDNRWVEEALGSELVTNGDMELDANWASLGSPTTNVRSSEQAHTGTYSRKFVIDAATEGITQSGISLPAGKNKLVFWVYPVDVAKIRYGLSDGAGTGAPGGDLDVTIGQWNRVVVYADNDTAGSSGVLYILGPNDGTASGTWYIDDVSVKQVTSYLPIGGELVSDPGFDDAGEWTTEAGTSIAGSAAVFFRGYRGA